MTRKAKWHLMQRFFATLILSAVFSGLYVFPVQAQQSPRLLTREEFGVAEEKDGGFAWVPWLSAGERIWKAVLRMEPGLKDIIGDGSGTQVATVDLDYNGINEIILYFPGAEDCGIDGCTYIILGNNGQYKRAFIANSLKRLGQGLNVDGRYYKL